MPNFNEITCKQFVEDFNGKELFKQFIPALGKMPTLTYKPFYKKMAKDVVGLVLEMG